LQVLKFSLGILQNPKTQQKKIQIKDMSKPNRKKPPIPTKVSSSWDTSCEKLKEETSQTNIKKSKAYLPYT
jgi:hypothetical protein